MNTFCNKVVWITGASSGYGEALAYEFAASDAKVILSARRKNELERVSSAIKQSAIVVLDLEQHETFETKTNEALKIFGHIDLVVHCGGVGQNALAQDVEAAVERKIMEVDYFGYTALTRCLLPHFVERGSGHIVVVSGVLARITLPGRSTYAAAKAALFGYFGCLRAEMAKHNINVTILIPSFFAN